VKVTIDDQVISGSSHLSQLILNRLRPFNLNELVDYAPITWPAGSAGL